ncbi:hypothetical protein ABH926_005882 [Catenulispora sp. GP43]|uniref:hypothetical protein n=1 Tax=Catenulispora sp. GP43 TaxID=3156263 RepID=UPI0035194B15
MPFRRKRDNQAAPQPSVSVVRDVTGSAVAIGTGNTVLHSSTMKGSPAQSATLDQAIAALRVAIESKGGELKPAALEQAGRMDQAANSAPPDAKALAASREWFMNHLPALLPAVAEVAEHPSVETALKAAGQVIRGGTGSEAAG